MSRIKAVFEKLKEEGRKGLIPFVTGGDPEPGQTVAMLHALADAGSDVIELGVPFSDPMADGPVIGLWPRASVHAKFWITWLNSVKPTSTRPLS